MPFFFLNFLWEPADAFNWAYSVAPQTARCRLQPDPYRHTPSHDAMPPAAEDGLVAGRHVSPHLFLPCLPIPPKNKTHPQIEENPTPAARDQNLGDDSQ
jgi:hypothetical protein